MPDKPMTFGEKIHAERKKLGLTLREVAKETGFSPVFISELEHGRKKPSLKSFYILSRFYHFEDKADLYMAASRIDCIAFISERKKRELIDVLLKE